MKKVCPSHQPEYRKAYRLAHPRTEEQRVRHRKWYWENRDKIRAKQSARYKANPQPAKDRAKRWRTENPDKAKASRLGYKTPRRQFLALKQQVYYYAHRSEYLRKMSVSREQKRALIRHWSARRSLELTDSYVREQLSKRSSRFGKRQSHHYWSRSEVESYRTHLIHHRSKQLTHEQVEQIKKYFKNKVPADLLAMRYGCHKTTIYNIVRGITRTDRAHVKRLINPKSADFFKALAAPAAI